MRKYIFQYLRFSMEENMKRHVIVAVFLLLASAGMIFAAGGSQARGGG
jgi:hypothetical protein